MTELTILDELKNLLPPLTTEEFSGLEADILKHGCLSPMIAWNGVLVDGHHRYEICTKHEIPFSVQNIVFDNLDTAKLWAWKHQEHRRNLTPFHRAELALKLKDTIASKAKERQKASGGDRKSEQAKSVPATLPELIEAKETRQELAELAGIGSRTLDKAEYVAEHADEETKKKLRQGEKGTSINKEYNRLRKEQKQEEQETTAVDSEPETTNINPIFAGETPGFAPGSPEEEKYSAKTTLKPIPRNRPDVLVRNLLAHFPKEFVPNMIRSTFQIFVEIGEKDQARALATEIYKQFGRK